MKRGTKALISLLCAGAMTTGVKAVNDGGQVDPARGGNSPYSAIWLRNIFDLKPPPPPPPPSEKPPVPSNVQMTGISTMLGVKRVLISLTAGKSGKPESYMMREGERQSALEILEINLKAHTVRVNLDGSEATITFSTNAAPAGAAGRSRTDGGRGRDDAASRASRVRRCRIQPAGRSAQQRVRASGSSRSFVHF